MDYGSMIGGGVVVVALGAFSLIKYVIGQKRETKTDCSNGSCAWTKEQVTGMVVATTTIKETSASALTEQRTFNSMFKEWLAKEEGLREGRRQTGEHAVPR